MNDEGKSREGRAVETAATRLEDWYGLQERDVVAAGGRARHEEIFRLEGRDHLARWIASRLDGAGRPRGLVTLAGGPGRFRLVELAAGQR